MSFRSEQVELFAAFLAAGVEYVAVAGVDHTGLLTDDEHYELENRKCAD